MSQRNSREAKAARRERSASRKQAPAAPGSQVPEDVRDAMRAEIARVMSDLGEGFGACLIGALTSHIFEAIAPDTTPPGTFRESVGLILIPMLLDRPLPVQRKTVAYLRELAGENIPRPPGTPANVPTFTDSADLMLSVMLDDPRTRHLIEPGPGAGIMNGPDFGDLISGYAADENDWTRSGPRVKTPRRTVTGTVTGLYAGAPAVARVTTAAGEEVCVRVIERHG